MFKTTVDPDQAVALCEHFTFWTYKNIGQGESSKYDSKLVELEYGRRSQSPHYDFDGP